MTLREFLVQEKLSLSEFGRMVGVCHTTVLRWRDDLIFPSRDKLETIRKVTGGEVTANDFMAAPAKPRVPEKAAA